MRSRRVVAAAVAGAFLLAACGGGDDAGDAAGDASVENSDDEAGGSERPADQLEVDPASDIATNVLPDVVLDDVGAGTKVNLRNVVPSDEPVLIWMWAPN